MATRIYSDWSEIDRELDRVEKFAPLEAQSNLDKVLDFGADLVRGAVDVETGSLKGSVKSSSTGGTVWRGQIVVGGGVGAAGPIDYAWYEYRRGGAHEFFYPLPLLHSRYVAAILDGLSK